MALIKSDCRGVERIAGEENDCTVRALANVLGAPYTLAHKMLTAAGRKPRDGMRWSDWSKVYSRMGLQLMSVHGTTKHARFIASKTNVTASSGVTLEKMLSELQSGRYVVHIRGHVLAVVDGKVYDYGHNKAGSRVASVYKLEKQAVIFDK